MGRAHRPESVYKMTVTLADAIIIAKYIAAVILTIGIICAPAWLARQNKKDKVAMGYVRLGSWVFGWSGIGWLWALFWATKK